MIKNISLKQFVSIVFDQTDSELNQSNKWPLFIDANERGSAFLRHRDTVYVNCLDKRRLEKESLRLSIIGAIFYNKPLVIDIMDNLNLLDVFKTACDEIDSKLWEELNNKSILKDESFFRLVKPNDGDSFENYKYVDTGKFITVYLISKIDPSADLANSYCIYSIDN